MRIIRLLIIGLISFATTVTLCAHPTLNSWEAIHPLVHSESPIIISSAPQPLKDKRIVLDPGHGERLGNGQGTDPGAIGPDGITERLMARKQAELIKPLLEAEGATVLIIENGSNMTLTEIGKQGQGADAFISLHLNAFNSSVQGHEVFWDRNGIPADKELAGFINSALDQEFEIRDRGVQQLSLGVLRGVPLPTPAVLVEAFFIDSVVDAATLEAWNIRAAEAIAKGIEAFLLN